MPVSVLHAKMDFAPKPVLIQGSFIFAGHKLHDFQNMQERPWTFILSDSLKSGGIWSSCHQWSLLTTTRLLLCLFSSTHHGWWLLQHPPCPSQEVLIKSLQVGGSQCLGLGEVSIRERSWPSTRLLLLLMIPSLTFWGDLSCPLTPVGRGKLKQLKGPHHGGLSFKLSSTGLLENAERQEPWLSGH